MALAALAVSLFLVGAGLWLVRFSIASFMIGAALAERGAEARFEVISLDLNSAALANVRFGSDTSPDAAVPLIEARWRWNGLAPKLHFLRVVRPRLHLRIDEAGRVSAGALDRIGGGAPGRRRPGLPRIELEILEGEVQIDAPFGALAATLHGSGALGRDFSAVARLARTSRPGRAHALESGEAELLVVSRDENIAFRLNASAAALTWAGARAVAPSLRVMGRAPLDLSRYDIEASARAASLRSADISADTILAAIGFEGIAEETSLTPQTWAGEARGSAAALQIRDNAVQHARFEGRVDGAEARGQGRWSLAASRLEGLALISENPNANGVFRFELEGDETLLGQARIVLERSRLNGAAQADLRAMFPDIPDAPVGPTFAQAERALDAAADRFDLSIPIEISADEAGARLQIVAPAEAHAASGAILRLAPLRTDGPALVLQWPGPTLHGAVELELNGGGAPNTDLLLDTVNWRPEAPFEADGTVTFANWRTPEASIATDELGIGIAVRPSGGGRIDLRGPARITGPLGDGEVRDLVATLDLAVEWGEGWRVTPNRGCLPIRLGGLDAAGLSFADGNLSLCPLNGALIAADEAQHLSGGFSIRGLALNGHMAGPDGQPARISAANVVGLFRGRTGNFTLAIEADAPRLAIEMAEARTLAVTLQRLTADANIARSWRISGGFDAGTLSDPALPGSVSAITGAWTAEPVDGEPLIRVSAGEALLTANRPASEDDRPLFHALRIVNAEGVLQDGDITASGAVVLDGRSEQLASFSARHDVSEGVGSATLTADRITFGPDLQPYDITEQARGLVDNVQGDIGVVADVAWTRQDITSTARMQLNGLSLSTATIPEVKGARGAIFFDNLFELTTPPGQQISIEELDPGITVTNGRVAFQLLREERVSIERAEFDFALGTLAMAPAIITLGADETRFEVRLQDVDASNLVQTLKIPDLAVTGRIEGSFPLLLTRRSAFVEHGVLRTSDGGGVISYTGNAGANANGVSRIAFDALREFHYDTLQLTLNGDLNGDVVSAIEFRGRNGGEPIDLGPIVSVPGVGGVTVRGVPFDFHVRVTAPFRRLAETAATIVDPGSLIDRGARETEEPVDPDAPPPR